MVGSANLNIMIKAARKAGRGLVKDFREVENLQVSVKGAGDFVSRADLSAEKTLKDELMGARPTYGWLAEEGGEEEGQDPTRRWIVDPLDGTKEFIHRRGDFTVNIALVEGGIPTRGVVYAPAKSRMFFTQADGQSVEETGDFDKDRVGALTPISVSDADNSALMVVASKSHRDQATDDYIGKYAVKDMKSAGSSLKFCLIATGEADLYPRVGRTMEWDTAAGHAVLNGAGGAVVRFDDLTPLTYGKAGFANPFFIAYAPGVALKPA